MLTRQQVVYGLERVELRSTDLYLECPFRFSAEGRQNPNFEPQCKGLDLLYRTADGSCNNLRNPTWGSAFMAFLRFLPPDYSDGVQVKKILLIAIFFCTKIIWVCKNSYTSNIMRYINLFKNPKTDMATFTNA